MRGRTRRNVATQRRLVLYPSAGHRSRNRPPRATSAGVWPISSRSDRVRCGWSWYPSSKTTSAIAAPARSSRAAAARPLDHPHRAARQADGPDEPALHGALGQRAGDVAVPQVLDHRIHHQQARTLQTSDEDVEVLRRRHLPGPSGQQDPAVRQGRQDRVLEVGEPPGRKHREVGAEAEVDPEILRVPRARQRRRPRRRPAEVHRRGAADPHEPDAGMDGGERAERGGVVALRGPDADQLPGRSADDVSADAHPSQ